MHSAHSQVVIRQNYVVRNRTVNQLALTPYLKVSFPLCSFWAYHASGRHDEFFLLIFEEFEISRTLLLFIVAHLYQISELSKFEERFSCVQVVDPFGNVVVNVRLLCQQRLSALNVLESQL